MPKKIVLIEDNTDMRENIAEILELSNYEVHTAANGKLGVDVIKAEMPDLIICDIMMPELDGYGVLKIISNKPETQHIPFIFLTAKSEKGDFRKGMNLGADDYLTKPFEDLELLDAVEMRLKKSNIVSQPYEKGVEGFNDFINEARGLKELENLSENRDCKAYRKKEKIFEEERNPRFLYLVNSGRVKTYKINEDGKEYITGLYTKGDFLGYQALLQNTAYFETAEVMEEAEVCAIPKDDFVLLMHSNKDVSARFVKMLANDLQEAEERLLNLAYNSVRRRVADGLLMLDQKYNAEKEYPFTISVLRDDLASIVGTAKESVIRTLSDFKEEGLITIQSGDISILDRDKLAHIIG